MTDSSPDSPSVVDDADDVSEIEGFPQNTDDIFVPTVTIERAANAIQQMADETRVFFNEDGIRIQCVDPANVALTRVDIHRQAFETYPSIVGRIGLDVEMLSDIVSFGSTGKIMRMGLDAETRRLAFEIDGLFFNMGLIDPSSIRNEGEIPDIFELHTASITLEGEQLKRASKAIDLASDHIRLIADPSDRTIEFVGKGDTDDVSMTYGGDDLIHAEVSERADTLLSLIYFKDIVKTMKNDTEVTINFGTEVPVVFSHEFGRGNVEITQMIAPRIESS